MPQKKRARRPKVDRAEPRRQFSGAFRAGASNRAESRAPANGSTAKGGAPAASPANGSATKGATAAPANGAQQAGEWESARDAGYEAINNGYRVIDEYMRQGQRLAEEFWLPSPDAKAGGSEFSRMMDRFLRSAGDMGSAWLEMMTQWTQAPGRDLGGPRGTAGPFSAATYAGPNGPDATQTNAVALAIDVEASRRVRVAVDCRGASAALQVHALVSGDPAAPPITSIRIDADALTGERTLHVSVPDAQPAGVYHGVLVDGAAQRPAGTITLTVL